MKSSAIWSIASRVPETLRESWDSLNICGKAEQPNMAAQITIEMPVAISIP